MKKCPYCAEEIQTDAIFCRFCGRPLGQPASVTPVVVSPVVAPQKKRSFFSHGFGLALLWMLGGSFISSISYPVSWISPFVLGWGSLILGVIYCAKKKDKVAVWWLVGSTIAIFACVGGMYLLLVLNYQLSMP